MAIVVGLDEVGRGCWAGPLVAAAVAWDDATPDMLGLRDSKVLSKRNRTSMDLTIREMATSYGIGWVSPAEIDELGMTKSVQLAMLRAMKQVSCSYDEIVIDGNLNFFANVQGLRTSNVRAEVKADGSIPAVSAASIIAKVARDGYMSERHAEYPAYGFDSHVGYGTAAHAAALAEHGICGLHRKSFKPVARIAAGGMG